MCSIRQATISFSLGKVLHFGQLLPHIIAVAQGKDLALDLVHLLKGCLEKTARKRGTVFAGCAIHPDRHPNHLVVSHVGNLLEALLDEATPSCITIFHGFVALGEKLFSLFRCTVATQLLKKLDLSLSHGCSEQKEKQPEAKSQSARMSEHSKAARFLPLLYLPWPLPGSRGK